MPIFKPLTAALSAALVTFSFSLCAIAQQEERFVDVGQGTGENTMLLDVFSIKGTTRGITYDLVRQYGEGMIKMSFAASCTEKRLFLTRMNIYSESGQAIKKNNTRTEVSSALPDSPAATAMRIVCRQTGVDGY